MTTLINHAFIGAISRLLSSLASIVTVAFSQIGRLSILLLSLLIMLPAPVAFAAVPIAGYGTALDFDGVDDHVVITGYKGITGTDARTIEAWIKTTDTPLVITSWGENSKGKKWDFKVSAEGYLRIEVNGGYINGNTPINDGQWHHVACTFENDSSPNVTDVKFYVDGQPDTPSGSKSKAVNTASGSDVKIGLNFKNIYFKGQIDELRIWDIARTQDDIQANMYTPLQGKESGLVALYDFKDGTGITATNLAGNHNGTLTNMDEDDWVNGIIGEESWTTFKNTPLNKRLTGYDADGNALTYSIVKQSSQGTIEMTDNNTGIFTYIPNTDITGTDTFTYQVNDGTSDSNVASVTINILDNTPTVTNHVPIAGSGTALDLDGIDDHIVVTGYQGITGTNARTIEAWVKPTNTGFSAPIVMWGESLSSQSWLFSIVSYGVLRVAVKGGSINGSTVINDGQWHHVACTFENDDSPDVIDVKLYVDGQLETITNPKSQAINTAKGIDVEIGKNQKDNHFKGQIDEVRIWNVARTQAEIQANMYTPLQGTEPGLVALYNFEDGTGTTATDLIGSHHGTLINMNDTDWVTGIIGDFTLTTFTNTPLNDTLSGYDIDRDFLTYHIVAPASQGTVSITDNKTGAFTYIPKADVTGTDTFTYQVNDTTLDSNIATVTVNIIDDIPAEDNNNAPIAGFGTALDFDGIDDYIVIPNYHGITGTEARTFEAWIKTTSGIWSRIVTWGNFGEASKHWYLFMENLTGFLILKVKSGSITGSTSLNDGQWHHIAYTFENDGSPDVTDVKLYVDGQLDTPSVIVPSPINTGNGSEVTIGHQKKPFQGQMDEIRIWNVARTQAQIKANMHHYLSGNEPYLQVYYTFDEGTGNTVTDRTPNHRNGTLIDMESEDWIKRLVSFDTTLNLPLNDILVGTDVDGSKLTYRIVTNPTHGTIQLTDPANGAFTYTPGDWHREVDTFTYYITDAKYASDQETAFIHINPTTYSTGAYQNGQKEVVNLSIPKAQSLIVSISGGTEQNRDWLEILRANGTSFNPPKKFSGIIDENFVITGSDTIKVLFTANDSITTEGATVTIGTSPRVLSNDKVCDINDSLTFSATDFADYFIDPTGNGLDTIRIIAKPSSGELTLGGSAIATNQTINLSQLSQIKYTPAPNYAGLDSFLWEGSNGLADGNSSNQAPVNLLVQAFVDLNGESMDLATAIQQVNSNNTKDNKITFLQDIRLIEPLPVITGTVKIEGNNHSISGNNQYQIFFVDGGNVHFSALTIQDGLAQGGGGGDGANDPNPLSHGKGGGGGGGAGMGGAIFSNIGSRLFVEDVIFLNNKALGGNGGDGGGRSDHPDGEPGYAGFKHTDLLAFGSGAGGGGSPTGKGSLNGNGLSLGQGGHGNTIGNADAGLSGDSTQMLGIGGGGGGSSSILYGGVGGDGGFGAGSGGSGSHGTDANVVTQVGDSGEFGGQGGHGNFQHAGGGGGGAGLGGAIFVRAGSILTLMNSTFTNNTATGGNGGNGIEATYNGANGEGQGGAIFIQTGATVITEGELTLTGNAASTKKPDIKGLLRPTVSVAAGPTPVKETGSLAGTFIISSAAHPKDNTISFSLDGTATLGTDYTMTGATLNGTDGTVTIPAMPNNSATLTITPLDDSDADPDETIQLILNQGISYKLDALANSAILTIQDNDSLTFTGVYLETSAATILNNDELDVVGKLNLYPETGKDLTGQPIVLTITAPDGITQETRNGTILTDTGQFSFENLKLPDIFVNSMQDGAFGFQASFAGTDKLATSTSEAEMVLVGASAGYAILIQGKIQNEEGFAAHNKTIDRIYKKFRKRGFEADNIKYFNYNTTQEGVDGLPLKSEIAAAFTELQSRTNSNPAPFYVVMIDHGGIDGTFHIYNGNNNANDIITPTDLDGWLNNLETGLNEHAQKKPRLVMLGACYSGSFIPVVSKTGRIVITSATAQEESYKGLEEPDGIRSGEYFMEEFFASLGRSENLKTAFEFATEKTEIFTRRGDGNTANRFYDEATQHPLLDDNGDGQGSNTFTANAGSDGLSVKKLLLGIGLNYDTNSVENPAEILSVSNTIYLSATESAAILEARVNNADSVNSAPVDIRKPSIILNSNGTETSEQLEITNLPRVFLTCTKETQSCITDFKQFDEPGMYEAFYFVRDKETLDISPVKRSVIYKNYANNLPPSAFDLIEPLDGSEHKTTLLFKWDSTTDADGPVTYNFIIAQDSSFNEVIYQQEELATAMTYVVDTVPLDKENPTTYYWKVEAVDPFGERTTSSSIFAFTTNNTNAPPGISSLHISSASDYQAINGAAISLVDEFGNPLPDPGVYQDQGYYNMLLPHGRRRARIRVAGYEDKEVDLETNREATKLNVEMMPVGGIPLQPGKIQFTATTVSLDENSGSATILVERVEGNDTEVTVDYAMADGSAIADGDYSSSSGTLTWLDKDERSKAINLPITDDQDFESDETFTITLSNPSGGTAESPVQLGSITQITVTIVDDEAAPEPVPGTLQFSASTYTATEGDSTLNLNVTRIDGTDGMVSVQYMVSGSAALNTDYTGGTGTLTWSDGDSTTKSLTFNLIDDDEVEETETLTLRLFEPTGNATLGSPAQATLSIADNDEASNEEAGIAGTLQFATASYPVPEGYNPTITVNRTGGSDGEVTVQYLATAATTAANIDYANASGTLTWANGDSSAKSFTVSTNDDSNVEGTETINLTLSNPTGSAILGSPAQTIITITDNDVANSEGPTPEPVTTSEPVTTPVTTPNSATTSEPATTPSSTLEPVTAPVTTPEPVTTNPGTSQVTIPNSVMTSPTEIVSTFEAGILQFALITYLVNEGDGELQTVTVTRTGNSKGNISVQYSATANGTAELGVDYIGGFGALTWADGDMQPKILPLTILADEEAESLESVNLMLFEPTGQATLGSLAQTTLIIIDSALATVNSTPTVVVNPNAGALQFSTQFYSAPEDIGLTTIEVIRTGGSEGKVSVQYTTLENGTALFNYDYVGGTDKLIWEDGDSSAKSINLMLFDDQQLEDLKTIHLLLTEPTGGAILGAPQRATLVVVDNDGQPEIPTQSQSEATSDSSVDAGKSSIASSANSLPSLGRGIAVLKDGSIFNANALEEMTGIKVAFRGGASVRKQKYQVSLTTTPLHKVKIRGDIEIASAHVGQEADILVVAGVLDDVSEVISLFLMLNSKERLQVWDGEFVTLIGSEENVILSPTQLVEIYHGLIEPVRVQIYFGYRLKENGSIYFNGEQPIEVQITDDHEGNDDNNPQDQQVVWHTEFSPNGEQIVVASSTGHVSLWDANRSHRLAKFTGHTKKVKSAIFSADSKWLVTSSHDKTARLWNVDTKQEVMLLSGHERGLEYATFNPNAQRIITASADKTARIWDTNNGETIFILEGHNQGVQYATFSNYGKLVVTASWDHTARLWDAETGEEIAVLASHENMVEHAAFSPDDQYIVTASLDKTARVWDTEIGEEALVLKGHRSGVTYAAFCPIGIYIVTTSWDNSVRLWDSATGEAIWVREHQAGVHHAAFSPDGQIIVTGGNDGTARLWETATGKPIKTLKGHEGNVWHVGFSPDGKQVISASWDNSVRVWEVESGEVVMVLKD